jgi:farnesyl diphosphate synthase
MSGSQDQLSHWIESRKSLLELAVEQRFQRVRPVSPVLHEAMVYACAGGGKRMRGLLVLASAHCLGVSDEVAMPAACAIEAMHAYSLIHDDLPCMDDDDLRRGKPTCHKVYGEALALLAGDALQALAFEWLGQADASEPTRFRQMQMLAEAAGSQGMAGGQALDLLNVNKPMTLESLKQMHACKTGALFKASVLLGGMTSINATTEQLQALTAYAAALGLAFQVVDDILDVETDTAVLGKTAGKDALANKPTMVSLLGLESAKQLAKELGETAQVSLLPLGHSAWVLHGIIDQVLKRRS